MSLFDRSPGGLIVVANCVLYGTVLVEIGMLLSGSYAVMAATLVMIVVIAALLGRWVLALMGPEYPSLDYEPQQAPARAPEPARRPGTTPVAPRVPVVR
ncbi:MAG: hypothetical protein ACXVFN_17535 [Solirubrobacteraceae bacterium]